MYILIFNNGDYWELPHAHTIGGAIIEADFRPERKRFEEFEAKIIDEERRDEDGNSITVARFVSGKWEVEE